MMPNLVQAGLTPQVAPIDSPLGTIANIPYGSTTPSLDLPAALQGLLGPSSPQIGVNYGMTEPISGAPSAPNPNAPLFDIHAQPGFAQGGMVNPGMPMGVGVTPQQGEAVNEQDIQMFMQQQPQAVQQIAGQLQQMIQAGEVTTQELYMAEQLATVALQNPQMYPQMRQFAIQQELVEEQDISPSYDPGMLFAVILAARAVKGMGAQHVGPAGGGMQSLSNSESQEGYVVGPGTNTSDSVPIRVSVGEYIIPAHIVQMKGKEFFDAMLEKYKK